MVSKGLGFQGERGRGGDSYLLETFLGVDYVLLTANQGEGALLTYYDEPKSSVLTPPLPPTPPLKL